MKASPPSAPAEATSALALTDPVARVPGVGASRAAAYARLGVVTVLDLAADEWATLASKAKAVSGIAGAGDKAPATRLRASREAQPEEKPASEPPSGPASSREATRVRILVVARIAR